MVNPKSILLRVVILFFCFSANITFAQKILGIDISKKTPIELIPDTTFENITEDVIVPKPEIYQIKYLPDYVTYNSKSGFPDPFCYNVTQDDYGHLWIALDREGLTYFNGDKFNTLNLANGLVSNHVKILDRDNDGNIWAGTYVGVQIIQNLKVVSEEIEEGLQKRVRAMYCFGDNSAFISLQDKGLFFAHFDGKKIQFNSLIEKETGFISSLSIKGNELYYSIENSLYKCEIQHGNKVGKSIFLKEFSERIKKIKVFDSKISVATEGNLFSQKDGSFTPILDSVYNVNDFIYDSEKKEWIVATYFSGLLKKSFGSATESINLGLTLGLVYSLFRDNDNNLWISTGSDGLIKLLNSQFNRIDLGTEFVQTIKIDDELYGATDKGYAIITDSIIELYENVGGKSSLTWGISKGSQNQIWFAGYGIGLYSQIDGIYTINSAVNKYANNQLSTVIQDNDDIYFCGYFGLGHLTNNEVRIYNEKSGLKSNLVTEIVKYKGDIFVLGKNWIYVFTKNGKVYDLTDYINKDVSIEAIKFSDRFSILLTDRGCICYDNLNERKYFITDKVGLSNNFCNSADFINDSTVYVGTNNGVSEITFLKDTFDIITFNSVDGFSGIATNQNGACNVGTNIYWGTVKGLVIQDINKTLKIKKTEFEVLIDNISIDEKEIEIVDQVFLNYTDKFIKFRFHIVDLKNYEKVQFSYRIRGYSDSWSKWSKTDEITLSNLPQDKNLIIEIKAKNSDLVESEITRIKIFVSPPFWKTVVFYVIISVFIILIVLLVIRARLQKLKQRQAELETEVQNATKEITAQKEHIEEVHKEITDSINYAERIQKSFLATEDLLNKNLNEYFVFFQPKDVVSGDFYWADELSNGQFTMVNADSTGHGVPGAIMSILNISSIEEAVKEGATAPHDIFNKARKLIIDRLKKDGSKEGGKDGMDASIICYDFEKNLFHYTAAQNPIWIVRSGELIEIKPEKMPMGKHDFDHIPFIGGSFEMQKGDLIYTLTDGFQDQFGGPKNKKFKVKPFKKLLTENAHLPMNKQKHLLKEAFENWRGEQEQVDDICVIGVRV